MAGIQRRRRFEGNNHRPCVRSKPSWMLVAATDRAINPDLERWYAKGADSHVVEVAGASYSLDVSHLGEGRGG
jgi:hypothetical protein